MSRDMSARCRETSVRSRHPCPGMAPVVMRHLERSLTVPTSEAIRALRAEPKDTNAILHVTC